MTFGINGGGILSDGFPEPDEERVDPRVTRARQAFARAGGSSSPHYGLQAAAAMINKGFSDHSDAARQINSAIDDEMESRVAQERELRRMEHEKELERMRQETKKMEIEALIKRLDAQNSTLPPGVVSRIRIDGQGRHW